MNDLPHNERLLDDVLAEESGVRVRETLLGQTLHLVRRQRRFRSIRRAGTATAVFLGLLLLVARFIPSPSNIKPSPARPYTLVTTQPLQPDAVVQTKPFPLPNVIISSHTVQIIATSNANHEFRDLNDDQLLELVPHSAILIRQGPHTANLVFVNLPDPEASFRE